MSPNQVLKYKSLFFGDKTLFAKPWSTEVAAVHDTLVRLVTIGKIQFIKDFFNFLIIKQIQFYIKNAIKLFATSLQEFYIIL